MSKKNKFVTQEEDLDHVEESEVLEDEVEISEISAADLKAQALAVDLEEELESELASSETADAELADELVLESGVEVPLDPQAMSPKMREMHEGLYLKGQIEAAVFASPKPIKSSDLVDLVSHEVTLKDIDKILEDMQEEYSQRNGGFRLEYIKGLGYQFQTVALAAPIMEKMFATRPRPLSRAALETLAIIAYRQPTTRATVEFIRGVDSGSIIKNLLDRELIKCVGRKEDAGRPMVFGTTDEFLHVFGFSSLKELPPITSFQPSTETMAQALTELEEVEKGIDPNEFVDDETNQEPEISGGLLQGLEGASAADAATDDGVATTDAEDRSGAVVDDAPFDAPDVSEEPAALAAQDDESLVAEELDPKEDIAE